MSSASRLISLKNPGSIYTDLPESGQELRLTLAKVNLRAWLPGVLCPPPLPVKEESAATTASSERKYTVSHKRCRDVVETALVAQPDVQVEVKPTKILVPTLRRVREETVGSIWSIHLRQYSPKPTNEKYPSEN